MQNIYKGTYVRNVINAIEATIVNFFLKLQFKGFIGSSGPSQSTIFGSVVTFSGALFSEIATSSISTLAAPFLPPFSRSTGVLSATTCSVDGEREREMLSFLMDWAVLLLPWAESTTVEASICC